VEKRRSGHNAGNYAHDCTMKQDRLIKTLGEFMASVDVVVGLLLAALQSCLSVPQPFVCLAVVLLHTLY